MYMWWVGRFVPFYVNRIRKQNVIVTRRDVENLKIDFKLRERVCLLLFSILPCFVHRFHVSPGGGTQERWLPGSTDGGDVEHLASARG